MNNRPKPYDFEYTPTRVIYGRGRVSQLSAVLEDLGKQRAMIVCGSNVGSNRAVMDPIKSGIGDNLVAVFDETTPEKRCTTVFEGMDILQEEAVDVVIGVGGGSSLNVGRAMCSMAPLTQSRDSLRADTHEQGAVPSPDDETQPISNISIPTTMAGADISAGGSISVGPPDAPETDDQSRRLDASITDTRTMPVANFYDPDLYATTPMSVLARSAMNGFDKGIETIYSREATPIASAHSVRALEHYQQGLPDLVTADADDVAFEHAAMATQLVQYGRKTNIIHTFGNGISFHQDIQQGAVHGIVATHVLRYVFEQVDAERSRIASSLGLETAGLSDGEVADRIIDEVDRISTALDLPSRLRDIDGFDRGEFDIVTEEILDNHKHGRNPPGIEPTHEDIISILDAAW